MDHVLGLEPQLLQSGPPSLSALPSWVGLSATFSSPLSLWALPDLSLSLYVPSPLTIYAQTVTESFRHHPCGFLFTRL